MRGGILEKSYFLGFGTGFAAGFAVAFFAAGFAAACFTAGFVTLVFFFLTFFVPVFGGAATFFCGFFTGTAIFDDQLLYMRMKRFFRDDNAGAYHRFMGRYPCAQADGMGGSSPRIQGGAITVINFCYLV
jgi:hypothetical protein